MGENNSLEKTRSAAAENGVQKGQNLPKRPARSGENPVKLPALAEKRLSKWTNMINMMNIWQQISVYEGICFPNDDQICEKIRIERVSKDL